MKLKPKEVNCMMDHLFNDMEQNQRLEEIEAELERQREAVLC